MSTPLQSTAAEDGRTSHETDHFLLTLRQACLSRAGTGVRIISGMPACRRKFTELEEAPASERMVMTPRFPLKPAPTNRVAPQAARMLVPPGVATGTGAAHLNQLRESGVHVRLSPYATRRMTIVNRSVAIIDLTGADGYHEPEAALVNDPEILRFIMRHYESVWNNGSPMRSDEPAGLNQFTERQRRVLELLAEGLTDDQISRELSVSSRSVRAEVSTIRKVLGAESRFQAGLRYAQLLHR